MKRYILLTSILLLALAACASPSATETGGDANVQTARVEISDLHFEETRIEVLANQPVRLTIKNTGALEHDFSILEIAVKDVEVAGEHGHADGGHEMTVDPDLHLALEAGSTGVITFTPTEPGEYEFYCTVAGHKEAGMIGVLVVK